ncbi:MAG TPA: DUF4375 domain-containing protein [Gallionellaceae bacterium]
MRRAILSTAFVLLAACGCSQKEEPATDSKVAASLEAFANRRIYARLDPAILNKIPDAELEQAILDYASKKLEGHDDGEEAIVANLPPGIRALYLTWTVEAEVNNGGFNQYYFNTDGKFASDAVQAFEYFGAHQHAALMREANAVRANEAKLMDAYKKKRTLEAFSESYEYSKLGPLDDQFYKLDENLSQLRIEKIRRAPEQFSGE